MVSPLGLLDFVFDLLFPYSLFCVLLLLSVIIIIIIIIFNSCCFHAQVLRTTLVPEFFIFYSQTERYSLPVRGEMVFA